MNRTSDQTSPPSTASEVLERATRLAGSGQAREAVAALCAFNRQHRSAEIEKAIVRFRHDAYLQLDSAIPRAAWPPKADDPFPDIVGVPTIGAAELSMPMLVGSLEHHASLFIHGLLSEDQSRGLADDVLAAVQHAESWLEGREEQGSTSYFSAFTHRGHSPMRVTWKTCVPLGQVATSESPRTFFDLLEALDANGVLTLIEEYLGEPPVFLANKGAIRRSAPDMVGGWHQDGAVYGVDARAIALWIALSPCGPAIAPGLDLVPGRFDDLVAFDMVPPGLPAISDATIAELTDRLPSVRPSFEAGDAVFFHQLTPHQAGTGAGFTDHRLAIEMWFFAQSSADDSLFPLWLGTR
jgi:hypothetical protein